MDFARKQLEKYGWSEGTGLGKTQNGLATALKPKLKFDNCGLGFEVGAEYTDHWWEKMFNNAANNISIEADNNEVKMNTKCDLPDIKKNSFLNYSDFRSTSKLIGGTVTTCVQVVDEDSNESPANCTLTEEELFRACSGRTAHKGARHGIKQSGKLSRIEKQEKLLLKKMRKVSLSNDEEDDNTEKKLKKLKKQMEKYCTIEDHVQKTSTNLKKRKKQKKSVSFNETVTTIIPVDLDTSFESEADSSVIGDMENTNIIEGIDQEPENTNTTPEFDYRDLSKAERQKLRKKKMKTENNTFADVFQQNDINNIDEGVADCDDKIKNLKKRKFLNEFDYSSYKTEPFIYESSEKVWNKKKRGKMKEN